MNAPVSAPVLEVEDLRTELDGAGGTVRAIDGVALQVRRGETFAIVGESGCGKSMTALSVLRLLPETGRIVSGAARMEEVDLFALPEAAMRGVRGRRIAMIFQEPSTSLNPVLRIGEQVAEVVRRHFGLDGAAARQRALAWLERAGVPDPARRYDEYPFQLSGGLRQRVMIAAALAAEPELLIADEPTTALDVTIQAQVLDTLAALQRERGMAMLLITHDLGIVARMAHRVAVMYAGQIVEIAPRERFFGAPKHPYTHKLFAALPGAGKRGAALAVIPGQVPSLTAPFSACRFADRCERAVERCRSEVPAWTLAGPEHRVRCFLAETGGASVSGHDGDGAQTRPGEPGVAGAQARPGESAVAGAPLLSVADLKVHFPIRRGLLQRAIGRVRAVDGVSFEIASGSTLALVGESGCGKTTVGKGLLQLVRPDGGAVRFGGVDLVRLRRSALRARRADLQIVFQDPYASLNPRMRVADILAEGIGALGLERERGAIDARIDTLLGQVGLLPDAKHRYPHEFSGGQRQRIAIARALAVRPKLIVCDEPTSALDVSVQAQILNLLASLQRDLGLSYLFITHNIAVVEYLAHEIAVMYLGRIVERGRADEVLGDPRHPYTQALLAAVPRASLKADAAPAPLTGDLPSPADPPAGCHFHPRCPRAVPACRQDYPRAVNVSATHQAHCIFASDGAPGS